MTEVPKLDFLGRELNIGDAVIFIAPGYRHFVVGEVKRFTNKTVNVAYVNTWNFGKPGMQLDINQTPSQLTKVDGVDLTMYLLRKS